MTSLSGTRRRLAALGATMVLAAMAFATPVAAAKPTCLVVDVASNTSFRSLQAAVDAASPAAELRVKGTCVGNTTIVKDLVIRGKSNRGFGPATLDGANDGRVLTVHGGVTVTLDSLLVRNGNATFGGGIATVFDLDDPGLNVLTVIDSVIRDNAATDYGGGIANDHGNVTLIDTTVRQNSAVIGGGIHNSRDQGDLSLKGASSVRNNDASGDGGGIYADTHGNVELHDKSSVHHNSAGGNGGGIYVGDSVVRLNDTSSVHSNSAGGNGGGVFIAAMFAVFELLDAGSITGNSPNNVCSADWPGSPGCT
jgi:predicted outer membrane repeat protein